MSRKSKKKSPGMRVLGFLWKLVTAVVALAALLLAVLTVAEYRPAAEEVVTPAGEAQGVIRAGEPVTVVSWNIGYGALGDNADFFMDGGKMVQTADEARVRQNLKGITDFLQSEDPDVVLLQEIDANSARSHGIDERAAVSEALPGRTSAFAYNFSSLFVPYPMPPIGHVESGLYTMSRAPVREAARISLPCPFSWPIRTVNLKRCLLVTRIPVEGSEHELVMVNLHLEAYDSGEGKAAQTKQLASFLAAEAAKGNWVIAGGDFNQIFSNAANPWPVPEGTNLWKPGAIDAEEFAGMALLMDGGAPTCRSLDRAYNPADPSFQYYLIDGFIVSSNVLAQAETVPLGFVHSDHNPVRLRVTLLPE
ncbi:MAG: endonuclease/exonuclease/phosphatase family protein [Clostridia bacterium]|nr:endonuclease/exonuclease/phosphatase family protein [Clostridia bacterium]